MSSSDPITVVLGQFEDLLARGLRELIESDTSLALRASGIEHQRLGVVLRAHRPAVALIDFGLLQRPAEVRELAADHPETHLILLTSNQSREECAQLLAFGASACVSRETQSRDVLTAIHLASRGLQVTPQAPASTAHSHAGGTLLTRREAEVLPLLQEGRSNAQIALTLHVSVETVRTHARNIYRKLGVSSRRELAPPGRAAAPAETSLLVRPVSHEITVRRAYPGESAINRPGRRGDDD